MNYSSKYANKVMPKCVWMEKSWTSQVTLTLKDELYTSASPTSFDTRNVGTFFEFEAAESVDQPGKLGVSIYLSVVKFLQNDHFLAQDFEENARGTANIIMPRFSNITQEFVATVVPGNHSLIGVFKDGGDETESKRVVVMMRVEMIAKE